MRYTCLLWDWNGTLADDRQWAMQAVNDMLLRRGVALLTTERYYAYIDTPIRRFYERVFDLSKENYDEILREYNAYYQEYMETCGALRAELPALLQQAKEAGAVQWVVTASNQELVEHYLRHYGADGYFDRVLGADNYHAESKVQRVCDAIAKAGIPAREILVIGDTLHDLEMANALQADGVLLAGGHQDPAVLAQHAPLCESINDLKKILEL